jgi:hypothetical protein
MDGAEAVRINVYSQELLCDPVASGTTQAHCFGDVLLPELMGNGVVDTIVKQADSGIIYSAVRLFLKSPETLHHTDTDDDRSAITWWLPKSPDRREAFAQSLEALAHLVRHAISETGLD